MSESIEKETHVPRRRGRSLFGPVLLIGVGIYFLLVNLGVIAGLNWFVILQLWPLLLIFVGLNIIARQAPGGIGSLLSALVGVLAVAVFGYALFFGEDNALLNRLGVGNNIEWTSQFVESTPEEDVETAVVEIDFGLPGAEIFALEDNPALLAGTVIYRQEVDLKTEVSEDGVAQVSLDTHDNFFWGNFWNPGSWNFDEDEVWQVGLSPQVPMELEFNMGIGSTHLDLSQLLLTGLDIDGGVGQTILFLPEGDYAINYNEGTGATEITLAAHGQQTLDIDGGVGSIILYLPDTMPARIDVSGGVGSFAVETERLERVSQRDEDSVWQTADFDEAAADWIDITVDIGVGNVRIESN